MPLEAMDAGIRFCTPQDREDLVAIAGAFLIVKSAGT